MYPTGYISGKTGKTSVSRRSHFRENFPGPARVFRNKNRNLPNDKDPPLVLFLSGIADDCHPLQSKPGAGIVILTSDYTVSLGLLIGAIINLLIK